MNRNPVNGENRDWQTIFNQSCLQAKSDEENKLDV